MDNLNSNLISKKNVFVFLFLVIVAVAIPASLKLVQTQQQLSSKAASNTITITGCPGYDAVKNTYNGFPIYNSDIANAPVANDGQTIFNQPCEAISLFYGTYKADAPQQWVEQHNKVIPTAVSLCNNNQNPSISNACLSCLTNQDSSLTSRIIGLNPSGFSGCTNTQLVNYWCNGGVSSQANSDCANAKSNTVCATACGVTSGNGNSNNSNTGNSNGNGGSSCAVGTTYAIFGTVKDSSGNLVSGVTACIDPQPGGCISNPVPVVNGTYDITDVRPGGAGHNVYIDVGQSGQYQKVTNQLVGGDICNNQKVDFVLQNNACPNGSKYKVSGEVTNNNQPIVGAKVCTDPPAGGSCSGSASVTDSNGNYSIGDLPAGGAGHNVYLDPTSLPNGVTLPSSTTNPQLVAGSVCTNTEINFTLSSQAGGAGGLKTKCYILAEDLGAVNSATSCSDSLAQPYTDPITVSRSFADTTTANTKTFYVKFINTTGVASPVSSKSITYNPGGASGTGSTTAPTITNVSCQQNAITITGTNFGIQGTGKVTANGQQTSVTGWNATSITATPTQLLDGNVPIVVNLDNNQTVNGQCTVNTTTVTFTAVQSCRQPGDFAADNVSVQIYDATSTDANVAPLIDQTISLDKNGKPVNFTPKLSQGKPYTIIVKAPNTVARAKTFTPIGGTYNLPVIILPAGDIYPLIAPDGFINQFDISELKHEWNIDSDVSKVADLSHHQRVNSVDYSCILNNNTLQNDKFVAATLPTASQGTSPSSTVTPVINTITPTNVLISGVITISGINFGAATAGTVNFYAVSATSPTAVAGVNSWTDTQITAIVPGALTPSTQYNVEVVTAAGVKSAKTSYFVGP